MDIDAIAKTFWGTTNDAKFHDGWAAHGDDWARDYLRGCARRGVDRKGTDAEIQAADEALG